MEQADDCILFLLELVAEITRCLVRFLVTAGDIWPVFRSV